MADGGALAHGHRLAGCDGRYGSAWLHRWPDFGGHRPGTPPGEVVPLPKFNPVPTRPVFEPSPDYLPPRSLRADGGGNFTAPDGPMPKLVPTPAPPLPDSAKQLRGASVRRACCHLAVRCWQHRQLAALST